MAFFGSAARAMGLGRRSDENRGAPGPPSHPARPSRRRRRLLVAALCLAIAAPLYPTTVLAANTWTAQTSGTTNQFLGSSCPTSTTCFAVGASGMIRRTVDGGTTWTAQTSNLGTQSLLGIACTDVNNCVVTGSATSIAVTTNSGVLWTAKTGPAANYSRVACPSALICFAVADLGKIAASTDGGNTWTAQTTSTTQTLEGVSCASTTTCWAVGLAPSGAQGVIYATTNGGTNWNAQTSVAGINNSLYGIWCPSTSKCYSTGLNGSLQVTTNGGALWTTQTSGTASHLIAITCWDATHCEAVGSSGTIIGTSNGTTWTTDTTPDAVATVQTVSQAPIATGGHKFLAPADAGKIWTTTVPGAGVTGLAPTSGPTQGGTSVVITGTSFTGATAVTFGATAATGYTVDSATQITATSPAASSGTVDVTVTTPGGGTSPTGGAADNFTYAMWTTQTSGTTNQFYGSSCPSVTTCFATGASGMIRRTTDGGTTWSAQTSNLGANAIIGISCFDVNNCVAVGNGTSIAVTTNSGVTWTAKAPPASNYVRVSCPSTLICFAVADLGHISATSNGGTTWTAQTTSTTQTFEGISCVSTTTCWAVGTAASGAPGVIYATTNGGTTWTAQTSSTGINNSLYGVWCTSTTKCFAVGLNGTIQVTTNGGTTWVMQTSPTATSLVAVACWDATHCEAVGINGTIIGTSNGTTWTVDTTPNATATLQTVSFAPVATGGYQFWAPGDLGQIWTRTMGATAVTGLAPTSGPTQGGTSVVITGAYFTGATAVTFGATAATGYTVNSDTQITATSPPGGIGGMVNVTVTTPGGGTSPTVGTADNFTYTCGGSLSLGAPTAGSIAATVGAGPATGSLPFGTWSDQTGCGSGWNGTIAMSLFHYQGVWAQTAGAARALGSTTSAAYTAAGSGYYTVTVTSYASPTLNFTYAGIESGTGTQATLGAGTTTSTVGTKGVTIVWGPSSTAYAAGMAYTIKVGNLSATALTLADAGAPATIAANAGTVSSNPTFTNKTANIAEGSGADPTVTVGAATKFVTAAAGQGKGDYTVTLQASVALDPSVWAQTYVAQVTYTMVSGP
jgi:photosystem II stability/assembly factor-like uncharacterized protein